MSAIIDAFDIQVATYGSGWQAISVAVRRGLKPERPVGDAPFVCLTHEALNIEEFEQGVDDLIKQLQALKKTGRLKLAEIQTLNRLKSEIGIAS
jgi:hypothetical protein